ncbi:MAG: hypothetical protein HY093_03435 [Candidatus Liptonbacteria bacterium]|nr:hypothetical protein [Candidatus Liptonbacteria bacterium]
MYPNPLTFVSVNSGSGYGNYTYGINVVECTLAGECSDCAEISSVWNVQASSSLAIMTGTAANCGASPRLVRPACLASSSDADDYTMMATMPVDKPENTRTIMSARDAMISDPTTCLAAMKIGGYRGEGLGSGNVRASPIYCGAKIGGCYGGGLRGPGPASLIDGLPVGVVNKETTIAAPPFSSKTARWA